MAERRPYDRKLDWAEKHLVKLERLVAKYEASTPYEVLPGVEDEDEPPRLHFTAQPHPDIPYILGDFLYNVRASLDYVMKAIAPSSNRGDANFPIFWQGVWEPTVEGEDEKRIKDRETWAEYVKGIDPDALTILKANQPDTPAREGRNDHALAVINRLRNKDTHLRGNVVMGRLLAPILATAVDPTGRHRTGRIEGAEGLDDGAALLGLPKGSVDVKVSGTVAVLVRPGMEEMGGYRLADERAVVFDGTRRMLDLLRRFDRTV